MKQLIIGLVVFIAACNTSPTARQTFQRQFDSTGKKFDEYRVKNDVFFDLYKSTGEKKYLDSSNRWLDSLIKNNKHSNKLYNEYYNN